MKLLLLTLFSTVNSISSMVHPVLILGPTYHDNNVSFTCHTHINMLQTDSYLEKMQPYMSYQPLLNTCSTNVGQTDDILYDLNHYAFEHFSRVFFVNVNVVTTECTSKCIFDSFIAVVPSSCLNSNDQTAYMRHAKTFIRKKYIDIKQVIRIDLVPAATEHNVFDLVIAVFTIICVCLVCFSFFKRSNEKEEQQHYIDIESSSRYA